MLLVVGNEKSGLNIQQYYVSACNDTIVWELNWAGRWHHCFLQGSCIQ